MGTIFCITKHLVFQEKELLQKNTICKEPYQTIAPQFVHRFCLIAKQQRIPIGKKKMARKIAQQSKSSVKVPTRHRGQPP